VCQFLADFFLMGGDTASPRWLIWKFGPELKRGFTFLCKPGLGDTYIGCIALKDFSESCPPLTVLTRHTSEEAGGRFQDVYPSEVDYEPDKRFIHERETKHKGQCSGGDENVLEDLRLVNYKSRTIVNVPGERPEFVALSYAWGSPSKKAKSAKVESWLDVPKTIQQSIHVNRALGYRYLWVDRARSQSSYLLSIYGLSAQCIKQNETSKHV
jgi:hypothetical protein